MVNVYTIFTNDLYSNNWAFECLTSLLNTFPWISSVCWDNCVKATHTYMYRRFEHVLSKLGRVEKTERLISYLNKLNWFTEMYLTTMSNTQMLSYWNISHLWKLCTHSPFVMDDHAVKHGTNLTWHICIGIVRRNIGIALTRNIRSATGCRICGGFTR
jgi:hypothetical protein